MTLYQNMKNTLCGWWFLIGNIFKRGGVSLEVGWLHTLADGCSAIHFINAWSDVTRGVSIAIPPSMKTPVQTIEHSSTPKPISTAMLNITLDQLNTSKAIFQIMLKTPQGIALMRD